MKRQKNKRQQKQIKLDLDNFDLIEPNPLELDKECCIQPRLVFDYLKVKLKRKHVWMD